MAEFKTKFENLFILISVLKFEKLKMVQTKIVLVRNPKLIQVRNYCIKYCINLSKLIKNTLEAPRVRKVLY
jgi:hypothetical protein